MEKGKNYQYPFVWIQSETKVKNLSINCLHRREYENPVATIQIDKDADVETLVINDISVENHTNFEMPLLVNNGKIKNLYVTPCETFKVK